MGIKKSAALDQTAVTIAERPRIARKAKSVQPGKSDRLKLPEKFTYALKEYTVERRASGWWISRTWTASAGEKPQWTGPFATIETACLAIARRLAIEIADRHTRSIEWHKIRCNDPLYGLKPATRLHRRRRKAEESGSTL